MGADDITEAEMLEALANFGMGKPSVFKTPPTDSAAHRKQAIPATTGAALAQGEMTCPANTT